MSDLKRLKPSAAEEEDVSLFKRLRLVARRQDIGQTDNHCEVIISMEGKQDIKIEVSNQGCGVNNFDAYNKLVLPLNCLETVIQQIYFTCRQPVSSTYFLLEYSEPDPNKTTADRINGIASDRRRQNDYHSYLLDAFYDNTPFAWRFMRESSIPHIARLLGVKSSFHKSA